MFAREKGKKGKLWFTLSDVAAADDDDNDNTKIVIMEDQYLL